MRPDAIRIDRLAGHSFLAAPIALGATVVDLGMNRGEFASAVVDRYGCAVVGVEPVPELFAALPRHDRVTVEHAAITADGRPATLYCNQSRCATIHDALSQPGAPVVEVPGTTLEGLLDRHALRRVALVKVDIEGAENAMIESASLETLRRVDQFTIEFHDFLDPELAGAVAQARRRLRAAGFADFPLSMDNTDVLFVDRARISFHRLGAAIAYKYPRGLARRLDRRLRPRGEELNSPART